MSNWDKSIRDDFKKAHDHDTPKDKARTEPESFRNTDPGGRDSYDPDFAKRREPHPSPGFGPSSGPSHQWSGSPDKSSAENFRVPSQPKSAREDWESVGSKDKRPAQAGWEAPEKRDKPASLTKTFNSKAK